MLAPVRILAAPFRERSADHRLRLTSKTNKKTRSEVATSLPFHVSPFGISRNLVAALVAAAILVATFDSKIFTTEDTEVTEVGGDSWQTTPKTQRLHRETKSQATGNRQQATGYREPQNQQQTRNPEPLRAAATLLQPRINTASGYQLLAARQNLNHSQNTEASLGNQVTAPPPALLD